MAYTQAIVLTEQLVSSLEAGNPVVCSWGSVTINIAASTSTSNSIKTLSTTIGWCVLNSRQHPNVKGIKVYANKQLFPKSASGQG